MYYININVELGPHVNEKINYAKVFDIAHHKHLF